MMHRPLQDSKNCKEEEDKRGEVCSWSGRLWNLFRGKLELHYESLLVKLSPKHVFSAWNSQKNGIGS